MFYLVVAGYSEAGAVLWGRRGIFCCSECVRPVLSSWYTSWLCKDMGPQSQVGIHVYIHVNFINITVFTLCTLCREARLHEGRSLFENGSDSLQIVSLQINCTGSHISILCTQVC